MNDQEFLSAFEAGRLANNEFRHSDHIRMAWLYLRRDGWQSGLKQIKRGIQRFAGVHHIPLLYHETITVFWAQMVMHAIQQTPNVDDFATFEEQHPHLFDKNLIQSYFSRELLSTDTARSTMAEPDVKPLPNLDE